MGEPAAAKYDVAISFLFRDSAIASELCDRLSPSLRVFFFPREQEELAGTDGMETMRAAFRRESLLSVVLFRKGWGETPWTRVEETAIQDYCFDKGWDKAFFLMLNTTDAPPKWFPETRIRFNMPDFGLEQAAGAIKNRALELGARLTSTSIQQRALSVQRETERIALQGEYFQNTRWINDYAEPQVLAILENCQRIALELKAGGINCRSAFKKFQFSITNNVISVSLGWTRRYTNVMSGLKLVSYVGQLVLPGEDSKYFSGEPAPELQQRDIQAKLSYAGDLYWVDSASPKSILSAVDVADRVIEEYVGLIERINNGTLDPTRYQRDRW